MVLQVLNFVLNSFLFSTHILSLFSVLADKKWARFYTSLKYLIQISPHAFIAHVPYPISIHIYNTYLHAKWHLILIFC